MESLKDKVFKALKIFGKLSTSRVAGIVGMNNNRAKIILGELEEEKKVKRFKETKATYWNIK